MTSIEQLNLMKYIDLQKMAKSFGLKANTKHQKLIDAIVKFQENQQQSMKIQIDSPVNIASIPARDKSKKRDNAKFDKSLIENGQFYVNSVDTMDAPVENPVMVGRNEGKALNNNDLPTSKKYNPVVKEIKGKSRSRKTMCVSSGSGKKGRISGATNDGNKTRGAYISKDDEENTLGNCRKLSNSEVINEKKLSLNACDTKAKIDKFSSVDISEPRKNSLRTDMNKVQKDTPKEVNRKGSLLMTEVNNLRKNSLKTEVNNQRKNSLKSGIINQKKDSLKAEVNNGRKGSLKTDDINGRKSSLKADFTQDENDKNNRKSSKSDANKTGDVFDDILKAINQSKKRHSPRNTASTSRPSVQISRENKRKRSSYEANEIKKSKTESKDEILSILKERNVINMNEDNNELKKKSNIPKLNRAYLLKEKHIRKSMSTQDATSFVPTVFTTKSLNLNFSQMTKAEGSKPAFPKETVIAFGRKSAAPFNANQRKSILASNKKNTLADEYLNNRMKNEAKKVVKRRSILMKRNSVAVAKIMAPKRKSLVRDSILKKGDGKIPSRLTMFSPDFNGRKTGGKISFMSPAAVQEGFKSPTRNMDSKSVSKSGNKSKLLSPGFTGKRIDFSKAHEKLFSNMDNLQDYVRKKDQRRIRLQTNPVHKMPKA